MMENHNWTVDLAGTKNSAITDGNAPYINNTLLKHPQAAYATNYYDNPKVPAAHPSLPNYIWLEAGDNLNITSDGDASGAYIQTTPDHLVSQLAKAGVSWHSYQEDLPDDGQSPPKTWSCGIATSGSYAPKHNPMVYFTDISGSPTSDTAKTCTDHVKPYTTLAADLTAGAVAQYNFITPNLCHDMHDACATSDSINDGDTWLSTEVPKILASDAYKNGGALFIIWDESEADATGQKEHPIGMILLSPLSKGNGYTSATKYYHSSFLRTVETVFGVPFLRDAANQPDLGDLFSVPLH
jgi:hypothetical protein